MIGRTISHYKITEKLGEGGMGVVYKADDTKLKRTVALKFLPPSAAAGEEERARFLREAQAAAALNHPNVCTVYEIDEIDGQMFISMAYLEGEDLAHKLKAGALALEDALDTTIQIAQGLEAAHSKGTIHRDIKPANVMITMAGEAVLMDFGLARFPGAALLSMPGHTGGTAAYMSPEQASGKDVDHRADLWSLGVVLYQALTGRMPFPGQYLQAILYAILHEDPHEISVTHISPDLREIIFRSLAKDPADRYQSATAMLAGLRNTQQGSVTAASMLTAPFVPSTEAESTIARLKRAPSVAVLPLRNMSLDPEKDFFSDGITEDIISALTKVRELRVAARNSAFQFKDQTPDIRDIGRKLQVDSVVTGSVRWSGNRLRLTVQLSNAAEGFEEWSGRYDRVLEDVFEIQDEISQAIVETLRCELLGEEAEPLVKRSTGDPEAYQLYLQGRHHHYRLSKEGFCKSIEYYKKAIALDANYAQPQVGMAISYAYLAMHGWEPAARVMPLAQEFGKRALAIDDKIGEAHHAFAAVRHWYEWDADAAEATYRRAIELNPGDVDSHTMYAVFLASQCRGEEALSEARRALVLDPMSLDVNRLIAYVYYLTRRYDEAIAQSRKLRELYPDYFAANWSVGMAAVAKGDLEIALASWRRAKDQAGQDPISEAGYAWTLGLTGRADEAREIIADFEKRRREGYFAAYFIAWAYLGLGDFEQIFAWLDQSYEDREGLLLQLKAESIWDPIRSDPRFEALLNRIGFWK